MTDIVRKVSLVSEGRLPPERVTAALAALNVRTSYPKRKIWRELYLDTSDWLLQRAGVILKITVSSENARLSVENLASSGKMIPNEAILDEKFNWAGCVLPGPVPGDRISSVLETTFGLQLKVELLLETIIESEVFSGLDSTGNEISVEISWRDTSGIDSSVAITACMLSERSGRSPVFYDIVKHLRSSCDMNLPGATPENELLKHAGIKVPPLEEGDELVIKDDDRHVDAAWRVLNRQFARMLHNEPGARLGVDIEYLHDMRVAVRRMRAALRIFRDAIPARRLESLKRELKWLGGVLGDARDLDVHLLQLKRTMDKLEEEPSADPEANQFSAAIEFYASNLAKRRRTARLRMIRSLDSKRYERLVDRMAKILDDGPPVKPGAPGASLPATEAATDIINSALRKVLKAGRKCDADSPDEQLHRLRKKCKRLRYACEFFSDLFGKPSLDFAKKVIDIQDVLGDHQDSVVARKEIASFAESASVPRGCNREVFVGLGVMIAAEKERATKSRSEFFRIWKKFDRNKTIKPLVNHIEKRCKDTSENGLK